MKSFKEYRKEKTEKKLPALETSFGSHSEPREEKKIGEKLPALETSFGSHSISKEKCKLHEEYKNPKILEQEPSDSQQEEVHTDTFQAKKDKLSSSELDALKNYTDDSTRINRMHRAIHDDNDVSDPRYDSLKTQSTYIDSAMSRHKSNKDTILYTGIGESPAKHFKKVNGELPHRVTVTLPAYTSTSTSPNVAHEFAKETAHVNDLRHGITDPTSRHILKIHAPAGTHGMSAKEFTWVPSENEVILHRGHNIEIHKTPMHMGGNNYMWHAKIVGHELSDISK